METTSVSTIIHYSKYPAEVASGEARALHAALAKRWPTATFEVREVTPHAFQVFVCSISYIVEMEAFAEGFLASTHLWER